MKGLNGVIIVPHVLSIDRADCTVTVGEIGYDPTMRIVVPKHILDHWTGMGFPISRVRGALVPEDIYDKWLRDVGELMIEDIRMEMRNPK